LAELAEKCQSPTNGSQILAFLLEKLTSEISENRFILGGSVSYLGSTLANCSVIHEESISRYSISAEKFSDKNLY
jgi:hypothetical protein